MNWDSSRNKNSPVFIVVVYETNSNQTEKLMWIENFEQDLTETYIKWSGIIIIAGDFNIDILDWKHCQNLHSFWSYRHTSKAIGKSKILIDHGIIGIPNGVIHHDILHI